METISQTSVRQMIHKSYPGHINQEVLKQSPDVIAGVNLLHLHLRVNIAVIQKVNVRVLYLRQYENRVIECVV